MKSRAAELLELGALSCARGFEKSEAGSQERLRVSTEETADLFERSQKADAAIQKTIDLLEAA